MNIPEIYFSAFLFREGKEYGLYNQRVDFLNAVFFERYVIDLLNIDSKFVHNSPQPLVFSNKDFMEWNNRQICTVLINRLPCGISLERPPKEKKKKSKVVDTKINRRNFNYSIGRKAMPR